MSEDATKCLHFLKEVYFLILVSPDISTSNPTVNMVLEGYASGQYLEKKHLDIYKLFMQHEKQK